MAAPDAVLRQTYAWYRQSIGRVLDAAAMPAAQRAPVERLLWQLLGVLDADAPPAGPSLDLDHLRDPGTAAASVAQACQIVAEVLAAAGHLQQAIAAADAGASPAAALAVVGPVMQQIDRLRSAQPSSRYPSALSIGKALLVLGGDAGAAPAAAGHEADQLAALLGAAGNATETARLQAALGLVTMVLGGLLDRSFGAPSDAGAGFAVQALPDFAGRPTLAIGGLPGLDGTLAFDVGPPAMLKASLSLALDRTRAVGGGTGLKLALNAQGGADIVLPVLPPGPVRVANAGYFVGLEIRRSGNALTIGTDAGAVQLRAGELGVVLGLTNGGPGVQFFARDTQLTIRPADPFLRLVLGDALRIGMDIAAQADARGALRLVGGTGLRASLPVPTLPTGPFELQLIHLGLEPVDGTFRRLAVEVSASFGVQLGPFAASVDRLGVQLRLDIGGAAPLAFALKPPSGIGLVLDAGIVKGGGYLGIDEQGYAGVLELKFLAVDVKAIALLNTRGPAGFSLLLLIFGQFPAVQLSFGFTLTGIGGLIGVQHTTSPPALSQALSAGQIDAVLFPENPVANAPQLVQTLRTLFPVMAGGFVVGPMLELGWGTPSLVTVRLGLLVEASRFTILGQAIVALPPLVSADLALLYLRLDFVGSVDFDPLRISFDAKLIHSRVGFVSITGQFAFRAAFGSRPTFLISAGGFHPRFSDLPPGVPSPFDRVGASLDIGIVGISLKGYFAITSATVQTGAELRAWADIGIASIEGGIGFDAICYLQPKFYFELDIHAYLAVQVFGLDFASVHLDGLLAGPGRWRIAGNAEVRTPWPLPDFSVHIDESFGTDRDTPAVTVDVADALAREIARPANWSAQLPAGGDGLVTLAALPAGADVLAHPLGTLTFRQKLVPLALRLDAASGSAISGANEFDGGALTLVAAPGDAAAAGLGTAQPVEDHFAIAQFLSLSADDRLARPSFESFPAGYVLGGEAFEAVKPVAYELAHEEADLGAPPARRRVAGGLYAEAVHGAWLAHGAAGASPLRDRALARPAQPAALRVDPPPLLVADKASLAPVVAGGGVHRSVWRAVQAQRAAPRAARTQVVEVAELSA